MTQDLAFELMDVSYGYGTGDVFRSVQLRIPSSRTILVTGPNGSGKTTLLKLLAGVLTPVQGDIRRRAAPGEMAFLGHETYVYPGLTLLENLCFWCRMYKKPSGHDRLLQVLQRVGLEAVAHEPASYLSRGMAQRLSLARVLILSAQVLFLDEPAAGLDVGSQEMMRKEIEQARQRGATVLLVTHSPQQEMHMADYVLQLVEGSIYMQACAAHFETIACGHK